MLFRQEVLNLFNSALPFLNQNAQKIIISTQRLAELMQSPTGMRALSSLNDLKIKTPATGAGSKIKSATYNPYSLFLIFYLLILAGDHQTLDPSDMPKDLELPSILPMPTREKTVNKEEDDDPENPILPL